MWYYVETPEKNKIDYIGAALIEAEWSDGTHPNWTPGSFPSNMWHRGKPLDCIILKVYNSVCLIAVCYIDLLWFHNQTCTQKKQSLPHVTCTKTGSHFNCYFWGTIILGLNYPSGL